MLSEGVIAERVADYLSDDLRYEVWIHPHSQRTSYGNIVKEYQAHTITIDGYYPDILALDSLSMIHAVEVKDKAGIRSGIGQAIMYKKGANYVFLAGPEAGISPVKGDILAHGVGTIEVSDYGDCVLELPALHTSPIYLNDVLREIRFLKDFNVSTRRITSLSLNHPVNYIAPILFFNAGEERKEYVEMELRKWGMRNPDMNIRGSLLLGLITEESQRYRLTGDGYHLRKILFQMYSDPVGYMDEVKRRGILLDADDSLAFLIKMLYTRNSDVSEFIGIISGMGTKPALFSDIVVEVIKQAPNLLVNLLIKRESKNRVIKVLQTESHENSISILTDPVFIKNHYLKSVFFQFKRQLIHLGILDQSKTWSGKLKSINLQEDYWNIP